MKRTRSIIVSAMVFSSSITIASEWGYSEKIDEFEDTSVHTAIVESNHGKGFAVAKCNDKSKFELYFSTGEFIGSGESYDVRYRIDKTPPESSKWGVSTKGTSVFVNNLDKVTLARSMLKGSELLLEVTDFRGTPHKSKYSLDGAADAIGSVLNACGIESEELDLNGVDTEVKKWISIWGSSNTSCNKQMLVSLGYEIEDTTSKKSQDVYYALQKYMDDKYLVCGTSKVSATEKIFECKQKDRFLSKLYRDAVELDSSFRETCGSLRMGD